MNIIFDEEDTLEIDDRVAGLHHTKKAFESTILWHRQISVNLHLKLNTKINYSELIIFWVPLPNNLSSRLIDIIRLIIFKVTDWTE